MSLALNSVADERGETLLLRPWAEEDLPGLIEIHRDPAMRGGVPRYLAGDRDARQWLEVQQQGWLSGDRLSFAVLAAGQLAGNVALKGRCAGQTWADVGYWTAPAVRGRGIAVAALETLTAWAFKTFGADGLRRLRLLHQVDNHASCRVAQKSGYALEAVIPPLPPAFPLDGHSHARYAPGVPRPS